MICFGLLLVSGGVALADIIPQDAKRLLEKHSRAQEKLDATLATELKQLKIKYTKKGDLESANAINNLIQNTGGEDGALRGDPLTGTKWTFLGIKRQTINEFEFLANGAVKCKNTYKKATWKRIDKDTILFSYGLPGSPQIVFHIKDAGRKNMTGYNSENGRIRYLTR